MSVKLERPLLLVGCGKMGGALLAGWLAGDIVAAGVSVVEPQGAGAVDQKGVEVVADADSLAAGLDPEVIVFAVKPQQMADVLPQYRRFAKPSTVFLSIAAGTPIRVFEAHLGADAAIVRAMPNTPAAIGQGITVVCPNANASEAQSGLAQALLAAVGEVVAVDDEALLDPVTALSGSGPAYVFLLVEAMAEVTVAGAGQLALQGPETPSTLRENVTSPGGTTYAALQVLMAEDGLQKLMTAAIAAATDRGRELAE
jgi:pyrroline-5-carboxylate reductase